MAIGNVLVNIASAFGRLFLKESKFKALDKADIALLIKNNIQSHNDIAYVLGMMSDKDMTAWMREKVTPGLKSTSSKAREVYGQYVRMLRGKAIQEERKRPLGSLLKANEDFVKILTEINKKLDYLVEDKSITMWNVRMSHLAIMGILRQSDTVVNFSAYLYAFLSRIASKTTGDIPKYRENYMLDKVDKVSNIVSHLLDKSGPYLFLKEVENLRKEQRDVVLGATGNITGFLKFSNINHFSIGFLDALASALSAINIFAIALDAWDDYKLNKYERNKEMKEWLETHVALLRMDLQDKDPSSPEYAKLVSIIEAYDAKIADYDKEIIEFENGD